MVAGSRGLEALKLLPNLSGGGPSQSLSVPNCEAMSEQLPRRPRFSAHSNGPSLFLPALFSCLELPFRFG